MTGRETGMIAMICFSQVAASGQQPVMTSETPGTTVAIVIDQTISSKTSRIGDTFPLHLAVPVRSAAGTIIIPAGVNGLGEVIHAAKAGGAGRSGELIVAARFLACDAFRIPLGHLHLGPTGRDSSGSIGAANAALAGAAVLAPLAGAGALIGFAIKGGEASIAAGTPAEARIAGEADLPGAASACVKAATEQVQHREEK